MDQLLTTLKKPAALLAVILLLVAAGCTLLTDLGSFDDGFLPVIGNLLWLAVELVLIGGIAVLLLLKKADLAKKALGPVFAWWIISTILNGLARSAYIDSRYEGLFVAMCVFSFLAALVLLAAAVFFVLGICGKTSFYKPGWLLFAASLCVYFIVMVLSLVRVISNEYIGWTGFVGALGDFAFDLGLFFAALLMWYKPVGGEKQEAAPAEAEAPAEIEAPAEAEAPAEEPEKAE